MIFIKDKKAWKELIKEAEKDYCNQDKPKEFPLYCNPGVDDDGDHWLFYIYRSDLQSMLAKLDIGREF